MAVSCWQSPKYIKYQLFIFCTFSEQNAEFLRDCGIQEWILDGEECFKDFFTWFNCNISSDNILTDYELME